MPRSGFLVPRASEGGRAGERAGATALEYPLFAPIAGQYHSRGRDGKGFAGSGEAVMIVVFGSINIDLITRVERLPVPGETALGPRLKIAPGGKGAN